MTKMITLTIPSDLDRLDDVQTFVMNMKDWAGLDEDQLNGVALAVSEAVTNAIKHGNEEQEKKKVHIKACLSSGSLDIYIEDEGKGFNPDNLPDPLDDENLLKSGGRGVFLMRQFADKLQYSPRGNRVNLTFRLSR